jgi:hypothetical protein
MNKHTQEPDQKPEWTPIAKDSMPPEKQVVMTKIDDGNGVRNEQTLYHMRGLWWFPDGSMYVYYTPTHWKETP